MPRNGKSYPRSSWVSPGQGQWIYRHESSIPPPCVTPASQGVKAQPSQSISEHLLQHQPWMFRKPLGICNLTFLSGILPPQSLILAPARHLPLLQTQGGLSLSCQAAGMLNSFPSFALSHRSPLLEDPMPHPSHHSRCATAHP